MESADQSQKTPTPGKTDSGPHATISGTKKGFRIELTWSLIAKFGPLAVAAATLVFGRLQHADIKGDADRAVKVAETVGKKAEKGYETLATPQNDLATQLQDVKQDQAKMAAVLQAILTARPELVPGSQPKKTRRSARAAPELAKKAVEAAQQLPAIQAKPDEQPAPAPVPLTIPKEASKPQP